MWDILSSIGDVVGSLFGAGAETANTLLQREQMQYQKDLQQQIFKREDNAYQRQIADLERAGLNKSLAYGSGGASSGSVVGVSTPQINAGAMSNAMQTLANGLKGLTKKNRDLVENSYQYEMDKLNYGRQSFQLDLDLKREQNNLLKEQVQLAQKNVIAQDLQNIINKSWYDIEDWDKNRNLKNLWYKMQDETLRNKNLKAFTENQQLKELNWRKFDIEVNGEIKKMSYAEALWTLREIAIQNNYKQGIYTDKALGYAIDNMGFDEFMKRFSVVLDAGGSALDMARDVKSLILF